jgi:hypothetical protein
MRFLSCMEQYGALLQKCFCILLKIACLKLRKPWSVLIPYGRLRISQFARNWKGIKELLLTLLYTVAPSWVLLNILDIPIVDQINILLHLNTKYPKNSFHSWYSPNTNKPKVIHFFGISL